MKSVMLLEGGSYRGIYTSGVLDVFMEHDVYPDCVVGVSAGSLNGLGYVAKQPGRSRDIVLTYGMDPRYVGVQALRREHNLVGFDFILREVQDRYPFDGETFCHSGMKFYAVAVNCRTGEQEYIDRDETEDILTAVAASSSMPFFCRKVKIGGEFYLDGGTGLHLPLGFLREHPEYDRVVGLDSGADDFISKPFGMMELIARIRAVLRRTEDMQDKDEPRPLVAGGICVDERAHTVFVNEQEVQLTLKEYQLLCLLMKNRGAVLTRDVLLENIWGYNNESETRTVDVHIRTLRQKLGADGALIETVRGVGYRMGEHT